MMKYRKQLTACALTALFIAAILLSAWTITNFLQAHKPLQEFRVRFTSLTQQEDPQIFDARFVFENRSDSGGIELDFMNFTIYYRQEAVASDTWFPDDFQVAAGEKVERHIELESMVAESRLQDVKEEPGMWEARGTLRIRRVGADRLFPIQMRQAPAELYIHSSDPGR